MISQEKLLTLPKVTAHTSQGSQSNLSSTFDHKFKKLPRVQLRRGTQKVKRKMHVFYS